MFGLIKGNHRKSSLILSTSNDKPAFRLNIVCAINSPSSCVKRYFLRGLLYVCSTDGYKNRSVIVQQQHNQQNLPVHQSEVWIRDTCRRWWLINMMWTVSKCLEFEKLFVSVDLFLIVEPCGSFAFGFSECWRIIFSGLLIGAKSLAMSAA